MARSIFISYRRDDTEGEAGRLFDDLSREFGEDSIFMDVDGISPGVDFRKAIDDNVSSCGVQLAIIGPTWSTIKSSAGARRLDDPNDFVRLEIASALKRNIAVIPVLVHDAKMPHPDELPEGLKDLAFRNSVEITHARWNTDVQLLIHALGKYVSPSAATDTRPVHATVAVQLPPPAAPAPPPPRSSNRGLTLGVAAVIVLGLGIAGYLFLKPAPKPALSPPDPQSVTPTPPPQQDQLLGVWTNPGAQGENSLNKLEISRISDQFTMRAWGKCMPKDCDWGTQPATKNGIIVTAVWTLEGRTATVTVKPDDGRLSVNVVNTYKERPPNTHHTDFDRAQ